MISFCNYIASALTYAFSLCSRLAECVFKVEILHTLHFDTSRKRMSVIVRDPVTDQLVLYCKGADSTVWPCLSEPGKGAISHHLSSNYHVMLI